MEKRVKDFFETVKNTAGAVGETVAEVTREGAKKLGVKKEIGKYNMEILRLRSQIEELYAEIGKMSYEIHVGTDELETETCQQKIDECLETVDAKREEIDRLNKQIELLNGGLVCPNCGRISPEEYDYCPACGTELVHPAPETEVTDDDEEEEKDGCCCCDSCTEGCCGETEFPEEKDLDPEASADEEAL